MWMEKSSSLSSKRWWDPRDLGPERLCIENEEAGLPVETMLWPVMPICGIKNAPSEALPIECTARPASLVWAFVARLARRSPTNEAVGNTAKRVESVRNCLAGLVSPRGARSTVQGKHQRVGLSQGSRKVVCCGNTLLRMQVRTEHRPGLPGQGQDAGRQFFSARKSWLSYGTKATVSSYGAICVDCSRCRL